MSDAETATAPRRGRPPKSASAESRLPPFRMMPIAELVPYKRNARTHSADQVALIARLITEFGWTNPVLIDKRGGIIAGHGRVLAAEQLGMTEVPTIELRHLTAAQKRAYIIADNASAEQAGWDRDLLSIELRDLETDGFDLELTGLDLDDVDALLGLEDAGGGGLTDPNAAPEPPVNPVSRLGDVWIMGRHRLHCADCMDVLPTLADIDAIVADQPYGSGFVRGGQGIGEFAASGESPAWDIWNTDWIAAANARTIAAFCPCSRLGDLIAAFGGGHLRFYIKSNPRPALAGADAPSVEPIVVYPRVLFGDGPQHIIEYNGDNDLHPTQKPVAVIRWLLQGTSAPGAIVCDPFAGSGTTIIAAEQTERSCIAVELSPAYCDVSIKRWQTMTGQAATLDTDGRSFAELQADRIGQHG